MRKDDCIFCKIANGEIPANALYEDELVKVIFDLGPASKGHVLILPKNHYDDIYSMDSDTAAHVFQTAVKVANALKDALGYDGLNIVQNNGEAAGQTVMHFHMHLIPRYQEDTIRIEWKQGKTNDKEIAELKAKITPYL